MAARYTLRLRSQFLNALHHNPRIITTTSVKPHPSFLPSLSDLRRHDQISSLNFLRLLSTARRNTTRSNRVDIGARARQLQNRRLWTYALTFSCIAGFIVIVLNNFQDQLVFYVTPTDALEKYSSNPTKSKFRLGGLVLEGSVAHPPSSTEMEFVVTDLITDILVRYQGSLPDLFREGHSVIVEGFVKPITEEIKNAKTEKIISEKARGGDVYFSATEVLAKHDEKYMPQEVAAAIEKNKKTIEEQQQQQQQPVEGGKES
ncbi:hypothetical protein Ddye_009204 [Dipteronia dyeriana]|uniref:Uncharacterized protein n=1 Tax=Dipteronia dyeriana TaxID=168575 RepID=A0AAD9XBB5_9ROSI|nr:hypothetical protein Ddye_009204 [Dipteronia dyeriana]